MLAGAGISPRRRWGQNFLIDGNLMRRLVDSAELQPQDLVLEVGAGTGGLTELIAPKVAALIAVEIDRKLHEILQRRLSPFDNVQLIQSDVLSSKHRLCPDVCEALLAAGGRITGRVMLVANLPYNIATPLLINLLVGPFRIERFCFTVQRELADRLSADPGTKDFGPMSVAVQCTSRLRRVAILPPEVFWPRPAVMSAMIRIDVERNPFETPERLGRFIEFVRACFAHRRKTLKYNLARVVDGDELANLGADFDLKKRPEQLTVDEWVSLGQRVETSSG